MTQYILKQRWNTISTILFLLGPALMIICSLHYFGLGIADTTGLGIVISGAWLAVCFKQEVIIEQWRKKYETDQ